MIYLQLFIEFFKIGLFSIGGGLATLPFLYHLVEKYGWITSEDLLNMIAVAESTPGPIGINTATFMGYKTAGILGGITATVGIVIPSFIIIILIAHYFMKFSEQPMVRAGFNGVRPAVVGLIGAAGFEVVKAALLNVEHFFNTNDFIGLFNYKALLLFTVMLFLMHRYKKHPILYIVAAGIIGVIFKY